MTTGKDFTLSAETVTASGLKQQAQITSNDVLSIKVTLETLKTHRVKGLSRTKGMLLLKHRTSVEKK